MDRPELWADRQEDDLVISERQRLHPEELSRIGKHKGFAAVPANTRLEGRKADAS